MIEVIAKTFHVMTLCAEGLTTAIVSKVLEEHDKILINTNRLTKFD